MKALVVLFFLCAGNFAFALGYQCTKDVTSTKNELTTISTWPLLYVMIDERECNATSCSIVNTERIANGMDELCGQSVDIKRDCNIIEKSLPDGTGSIDVTCAGGASLLVKVSNTGAGIITCSWLGIPRNSWDVGTCIIP